MTGRIVNIAVRSGQQVEQGQTLIALDAGKQQAELAEQSASVRDGRASCGTCAAWWRAAPSPPPELEGRRPPSPRPQARVDAARYEALPAPWPPPFDGTVSLIDLSEGALVSSGDVLLHLDELAKLRLDLAVPRALPLLLRPGMAVTATSSAWRINPSPGAGDPRQPDLQRHPEHQGAGHPPTPAASCAPAC